MSVRQLPESMREALAGSRAGDRVRVDAWYDNRLVADDLPVASWSYTERLDQKIKAQFSCTLADIDPALVPVALGDPLSPAGGRLTLAYECGGESVDLARMAITKTRPNITRRIINRTVRAVSGVVDLEADDLTHVIDTDRLLAPYSPDRGMSVAEVATVIADGLVPIVFDVGTDSERIVSPNVVFERERLDALEDLAKMAGGFLRMSGDGTLHVTPDTPDSEPVAEVVGGDRGLLVTSAMDLSMDRIYNAVVSSSAPGAEGELFIASAFQEDGPLRFGGPAGRRPLFHSSPTITSKQAAQRDADTTLRNRVAGRVMSVEMECLPNPAVQVGDRVGFASLLDGTHVDEADLTGRVTGISMSGSHDGVQTAKWTVEIPIDSYRMILGGR